MEITLEGEEKVLSVIFYVIILKNRNYCNDRQENN